MKNQVSRVCEGLVRVKKQVCLTKLRLGSGEDSSWTRVLVRVATWALEYIGSSYD